MNEFKLLPKVFNWQNWRQPVSTNYLGKEYLGGIIFNLYIGEDGEEHGHVVSIAEIEDVLQNPPSLVQATSSWDGATNTSLYINSPAKTWVESLGSGWYLPSIDELNLLFDNRYYVNKTLSEIAGATQLWIEGTYWTSTELLNNGDFAYVLTAPNGPEIPINYNKANTFFIRGVKSF